MGRNAIATAAINFLDRLKRAVLDGDRRTRIAATY
jgi:hypothetical protein